MILNSSVIIHFPDRLNYIQNEMKRKLMTMFLRRNINESKGEIN